MKTLKVSKKLFSKYKRIEDAVLEARNGDIVQVEPGDYEDESIYIYNSIKIIGQSKEEVTIKGKIMVKNHDSLKVELEGLTLEASQPGLHTGTLRGGINIETGPLVINDCLIHNIPGSGITVEDQGELLVNNSNFNNNECGIYVMGKATIENCEFMASENTQIFTNGGLTVVKSTNIKKAEGDGLRFINQSEGIIDNCLINEHEYVQVSIEENSFVQIIDCTIHSSKDFGVYVKNAESEIINSHIYNNSASQIGIEEDSKVKVIDCKIQKGHKETMGITMDNSYVELEECEISDHDFVQVFINNSEFHIENSNILNGEKSGISIHGQSEGSINDCTIENHGQDPQILLVDDSSVSLINSIIRNGQGMGVVFDQNSNGKLDNCKLYNNNETQLSLLGHANAELRKTHIFKGKENGIFITDQAQLIIEDSEIYEHEYPQLLVEKDGFLEMKRCSISDSDSPGLLFCENSGGIVEYCYIFKNYPHQIVIQDGCKPMLKNNRITDGGDYGIFIEGSNPIIENCEIKNHLISDIFADEDSSPMIIGGNLTETGENANSNQEKDNYLKMFGFNPYELEQEDLEIKLEEAQKKWLKRINAPKLDKRQEAERMLEVIDHIKQEMLE